MDICRWQAQLLQAVLGKLDAERDVFERSRVWRLDIGISPWHGYIELSFQSIDETALMVRIGDWRLYNFTQMQEGKWPESEGLGKEMEAHWTADPSVAEMLFQAAGAVARSSELRSRLFKFSRDILSR